MTTHCPRCSRANPAAAAFCFFDGSSLGSAAPALDPARQRFPRPFQFPSGKQCQSFDELVLACCADWQAAQEMVRQGALAAFLGGLGRADLARAAQQARADADPDRALDGLLRLLPSTQFRPPKLSAQPLQFNLGETKPGKELMLELKLENAGMGLLTGSASTSEPWLLLGRPGALAPRKLFQFLHDTVLPVYVPGDMLRASGKPFIGAISLETNGGSISVPVTFSVPVVPYPDGPLAGATTPRQLAEMALSKAKEAGEYFASGAVAKWYAQNGWEYPVAEPANIPVAAVQQYFEALGLSKPVKVSLDRYALDLSGPAGGEASGTVVLSTDERRPIWAVVSCSAPWLDLREVSLEKKTATVRLGSSRVPGYPGEQHTARVTLITNGRVKHLVTVKLTVQPGAYVPVPQQPAPVPSNPFAFDAPAPAYAPAPAPAYAPPPPPAPAPVYAAPAPVFAPPAPPPVPPPVPGGRATLPSSGPPLFTPTPPPRRSAPEVPADDRPVAAEPVRQLSVWAPVVILLAGLLVALVRDVIAFATDKAPEGPKAPAFKDDDPSKYDEELDLDFHATDTEVNLAEGGSLKPGDGGGVAGTKAKWPATMRFALSLRKGGSRLTYSKPLEQVWTNNCVVKVDGATRIFGDSGWHLPNGSTIGPVRPGRWVSRAEDVEELKRGKVRKRLKQGKRSVWRWDDLGVEVTQTVGLVPNFQSRSFDTCLVHYKVKNVGDQKRQVGLRFLLDTFIGTNDGVPFLIPGDEKLCSTKKEFNNSRQVPDFIQACEREDDDRGTVAQIGLRLSEPGLAPPTRVALGAYPNPLLRKLYPLDTRFQQEMTDWEVPVVEIKKVVAVDPMSKGDSAVVIYWDPEELAPGKSREMAFTYGLGQVTGKSDLALTVGGSFVPGGEFTLTAYVKDPKKDQTLKLTLPDGFKMVKGDKEMDVPPLPGDGSTTVSPVTWKIKAGGEGAHTLTVESSDGLKQKQTVRVRSSVIFGG